MWVGRNNIPFVRNSWETPDLFVWKAVLFVSEHHILYEQFLGHKVSFPSADINFYKYILNKKVLLRGRKRHTAHYIASTVMLFQLGVPPVLTWDLTMMGGNPLSWPGIGVPSVLTWDGGIPCCDLGWGTPAVVTWDGVPPILTWDGVPPQSERMWIPHPSGPDGCNPPPPPSWQMVSPPPY